MRTIEMKEKKKRKIKSKERCPDCDESGCSIYDCEICVSCGGTNLLDDVVRRHSFIYDSYEKYKEPSTSGRRLRFSKTKR